jgi:APA family basic amino acid/polyamine antiporter
MESRQLKRSLGLGMVIVVAVANIIGSGVYKKVSVMATELHSSGWILICWVLGGIISLFGALSNAEVAGLLADTGGEYVYYQRIYNRFFAFIFGWSIFAVIETAAISSLAYVFAQSVGSMIHLPDLFPSLENFSVGGIFFPFVGFNIKVLGIFMILLFTWINSRGINTGVDLSAITLVLIFIGISIIVIFGLSSSRSNLSQVFNMKSYGTTPVTLSAVFSAMMAAFWAYQGWAAVGYIGGEVKNAKRNIPLGLITGVFIIIAIYLLVNVAYMSVLSVPQLEAIGGSPNSIAAVEAVRQFWGSHGVIFISALIAITTLSAMHVTILSACRMYYAMAKEGMFFSSAARLNNAQVPGVSLWFQGIWASILVLSGTFDQLTDRIIFAVFIYYGATAIGVFVLRRKMPDAYRPYKVWGYPFVPAIVVIFSAALFFNTIITQTKQASIGLVLMLSGVPLYFYFRKKHNRLKDDILQ